MYPKVTFKSIHKNIEWEEWIVSVICFDYEYKGNKSTCDYIWKLSFDPSDKDIKALTTDLKKAIYLQEKERIEANNKFKKEMKQKQIELNEMRKFVQSRGHDPESIKKALQDYKLWSQHKNK